MLDRRAERALPNPVRSWPFMWATIKESGQNANNHNRMLEVKRNNAKHQ
jgi:hypothetical protein